MKEEYPRIRGFYVYGYGHPGTPELTCADTLILAALLEKQNAFEFWREQNGDSQISSGEVLLLSERRRLPCATLRQ